MNFTEYPSESDAREEDCCVDTEAQSANEIETDNDLANDSDNKKTSNNTKGRNRKTTSKS